jgi:hypothetical protein
MDSDPWMAKVRVKLVSSSHTNHSHAGLTAPLDDVEVEVDSSPWLRLEFNAATDVEPAVSVESMNEETAEHNCWSSIFEEGFVLWDCKYEAVAAKA